MGCSKQVTKLVDKIKVTLWRMFRSIHLGVTGGRTFGVSGGAVATDDNSQIPISVTENLCVNLLYTFQQFGKPVLKEKKSILYEFGKTYRPQQFGLGNQEQPDA